MFEQLFGSKTRVKLLQLFFSNPNRAFYVREITRKIDEQINSVRRELANLLNIGIISSDANNNRLYYEVNQEYEYFGPMSMIFGGVKEPKAGTKKKDKDEPKADVSPEHPMAKALRSTGKVELAVLTGQFTRDDKVGVDILIVGEVSPAKVSKFIAELEKSENKTLRYTVMPLNNYQYRVQINDRFIGKIIEAKKQVVINSQNITV